MLRSGSQMRQLNASDSLSARRASGSSVRRGGDNLFVWIDEPPTPGEILAIDAVTWFEMGLTADDASERLLAR